MQTTDLLAIGKLGKSLDKNGFISFKEDKEIDLSFLKEIFLLFTDNRVRFVEVVDIDTTKDIKIKIDDSEIASEAALDGYVQVMLPKTEVKDILIENGFIGLEGMTIVLAGKIIGNVTDSFFNGAHEVISFDNELGKEIMIPLVEAYVIEIGDEQIILKNIGGFLQL